MPLDHFVSQVHLKRFYASDLGGKKMHAIRKTDGRKFPCGSEDVCRIEDGNTNTFLSEPRMIEEFAKLFEPKYNWACAALEEGQVHPNVVFVIAGFAAFVMCCSPTGMRLGSAPLEALVPIEAQLMDRMGLFDIVPPELGEKSVTELINEGSLVFDIDGRYPQAIGIRNIVDHVTAFGNFHWDILINKHADTPFFTSDFPVAIEENSDPRIANRIVPLTPWLAIRICPRVELSGKKLEPTFEHFSYTAMTPSRHEILTLNRTIVRSAETIVFYPLIAPWVEGFVRKHAKFRVEIETTNIGIGTGFLSTSRTVVRPRNAPPKPDPLVA
ncbi:MAG: DUF4238 domain-containing protein [Novosphingobium sp.]|uniref:DUF4238 domain-containing protein n=1 Tax=Novosphingobium sp. TaxID=1874826 RepID=UPI0032BB80F9